MGMVTSVQPQVGLVVKLPFGGTGSVSVTDVADTYRPNPLEAFRKDQLVRLVDDEVQRSLTGSSKKKKSQNITNEFNVFLVILMFKPQSIKWQEMTFLK